MTNLKYIEIPNKLKELNACAFENGIKKARAQKKTKKIDIKEKCYDIVLDTCFVTSMFLMTLVPFLMATLLWEVYTLLTAL